MTEFLETIYYLPLTTYHLFEHIGQVVSSWPWPEQREWFGSIAIFVGLYPVRLILAVMVPEKEVRRRVYRRRKSVPTKHEHQAGAAASTSILHHV